MIAADANQYTAELSPELASRFLLIAGVGLPARRATCLLELQQHVIRTFGQGAPARTEKINRDLYSLVTDWYHWADTKAGLFVRRFAGI
jgi:endonuclease III